MKSSKLNLTCKVAAACTAVALTLSAVGCSKQNDAPANAGTQSSDKPVTLKLITWSNQATLDALKTLNDNFTKKYPNIKVQVDSVEMNSWPQLQQTRIAAGDVDIITGQAFIANPDWAKGLDKTDFQQFIEAGDYLDITDQPFVKNWDPNAIKDAGTFNGKVYGLNVGKVAVNGIFYNKAMFEQYGLKIPTSWDEFVTLCQTLQSKGVAPMTIGGKDGWPLQMMHSAIVESVEPDTVAYTKGLWDGSRKFNDANSLKIFQRMDQFASFLEKGSMGIDYASVVGRFVAGKAAMLPDGSWDAATISKADPNFKYGYFAIPGDNTNGQPAQLTGKYDLQFQLFGKTKNKDAALKWMEFLSEKENYTQFVNTLGFLPTMPGVTMNNDFVNSLAPINKNFKLIYELVYKAPKGIGQYGGFQMGQLKTLGGKFGPQELANQAQNDWDTALKANGLK